jgi:hypothetical protein
MGLNGVGGVDDARRVRRSLETYAPQRSEAYESSPQGLSEWSTLPVRACVPSELPP